MEQEWGRLTWISNDDTSVIFFFHFIIQNEEKDKEINRKVAGKKL